MASDDTTSAPTTAPRVVAICGGGGKTTIANAFPDLFVDIDALVWSDHSCHEAIVAAIERNDQPELGRIYHRRLTQLAQELRQDGRVVLVHHPCNAEWLCATLLGTMRPTQALHARSIADRSPSQMQTARASWANLDAVSGVWEYSSHEALEARLLGLASGRVRG